MCTHARTLCLIEHGQHVYVVICRLRHNSDVDVSCTLGTFCQAQRLMFPPPSSIYLMHGNSLVLGWVLNTTWRCPPWCWWSCPPLLSPFLCLPALVAVLLSFASQLCWLAAFSQPHFGSSLIEFVSRSEFCCPFSPDIRL